MSASASDVRLYSVNPWRQFRVWLIFGPLIVLILGEWLVVRSSDAEAGYLLLAYAGGIFLVPLSVTLLARRARLELSARGLRLQQTGYALETSWSNVVALRLDRGREGFVTEDPIDSPRAARLASAREVRVRGTPLYDGDQQALLAEHRFIPIESFAWHLRHGNLRTDIACFAPHLQATLDQLDKTAAHDEEDFKRREVSKFLALGALIVIGATVLAVSPQPFQMLILRAAPIILIPLLVLRTAYSAWGAFHLRAWWLGVFFVAVAAALLFVTVGLWVEFAGHRP